MNRAKRVVNSIFTDNPVRLSEEVNAALLERASVALQNKRMQVVSEMFDEGEFSTKQLKRSIVENKAEARAMVIEGLAEASSGWPKQLSKNGALVYGLFSMGSGKKTSKKKSVSTGYGEGERGNVAGGTNRFTGGKEPGTGKSSSRGNVAGGTNRFTKTK